MKPLLLIVEDDPDDVEFFNDALKEFENAPELKIFVRGDSLIHYLNDLKFSVTMPPTGISLDINLPGMNGYEILCKIKSDARWAIIPVFMVSTAGTEELKKNCIKAGAIDFFTKPVKLDEWVKMLKKIIKTIHS